MLLLVKITFTKDTRATKPTWLAHCYSAKVNGVPWDSSTQQSSGTSSKALTSMEMNVCTYPEKKEFNSPKVEETNQGHN